MSPAPVGSRSGSTQFRQRRRSWPASPSRRETKRSRPGCQTGPRWPGWRSVEVVGLVVAVAMTAAAAEDAAAGTAEVAIGIAG